MKNKQKILASDQFASIRTKTIIGKDKMFELLKDPNIMKVELTYAENRVITNEHACKAHIYYRITFVSFSNLLGQCLATHDLKDDEGNFVVKKKRGLLSGLQSCKHHGWIALSDLNKIAEIERENNITIPRTEEIRSLVKKLNNQKLNKKQ